jgi:hypothetical protein
VHDGDDDRDLIVPYVFGILWPLWHEGQWGRRGEWTYEGSEWRCKDKKGEKTIPGV